MGLVSLSFLLQQPLSPTKKHTTHSCYMDVSLSFLLQQPLSPTKTNTHTHSCYMDVFLSFSVAKRGATDKDVNWQGRPLDPDARDDGKKCTHTHTHTSVQWASADPLQEVHTFLRVQFGTPLITKKLKSKDPLSKSNQVFDQPVSSCRHRHRPRPRS